MKEIMKKNKELIVAIAVVLILIVTGSFAWLTLTKTMLGWLLFPGIYFYLVERIQKVHFKGVES